MLRVVIEPKDKEHIPNYIVVGKEEKVQGQVQYRKKYGARPEMCSDCYSEEHLRRAEECEGIVEWEKYVEQFELRWNEEARKEGHAMKRSTYISDLKKEMEELKRENELLVKAAEDVERSEDLEKMKEKVKTLEEERDQMIDNKKAKN